MKLQNKLLVALTFAWTLFLVSTYFSSERFLLKGFLALEAKQVSQDVNRLHQALNFSHRALATFTTDWGHWNDAYLYMQGKNPNFLKNNFTLPAFLNADIDFLTYWNNNLQLVASVAIDQNKKMYMPFPNLINQTLKSNSHLINQAKEGFIYVPKLGILLLAAASITDGANQQPQLGTVIAGRMLTAGLIEQIKNMTQLSVQLYTLPELTSPSQHLKIYQTLVTQNSQFISVPKNLQSLQVYTLLRDINHQPIGMLEIHHPRALYLAGVKMIHYYLGCFVAVATLTSILLLFLLRLLIVKRLEKLNQELSVISRNKAIERQVTQESHDELTNVTIEINAMLKSIQSAQQTLELRIKERTSALEKANDKLYQEIEERKMIEQELLTHKAHLQHLAHHDTLTSLPNRTFFHELHNKLFDNTDDQNKLLALIFIDLDRFKQVNDIYGHTAGDKVLKEISQRFVSVLRTHDKIARIGGDEFIVLIDNLEDKASAYKIAQRLFEASIKPIQIEANNYYLSASIGVAYYPENGTSLEELQKNADFAMYQAKQMGGGINHYSPKKLTDHLKNQIESVNDLRKAIINREFILYYQPKLSVIDNQLVGVEALLRWLHPTLGLVSPNQFIPLLEETNLIIPVGNWILHEACCAAKRLLEQGIPLSISVNLSAKQLSDPQIVNSITAHLTETELPAYLLELEITETAVVNDMEYAVTMLNELDRLGVRITLDDFGTGQASLNYLKQFPISTVKIDQSFIKNLPFSSEDKAITNAIIKLAHELGIKVVAEGVEQAAQLAYLKSIHCDIIQGYLISKPLPEAELLAVLNNFTQPL